LEETLSLILSSDRNEIALKFSVESMGFLIFVLLIKYSWTKQEAIELDIAIKFEEDLAEKIRFVFGIFGETI
jgi:hypothetical protein